MTIGNFDGMHVGHRQIIQTARALADGNNSPLTVVTFEPHPLTVLRPGSAPPRLTPPPLKQQLIASAGADRLVNLPPSPQILGMTAAEFFALLRDPVRPAHLVEGHSFSFGKDRQGTVQRLVEWTAGSAISLHVVESRSVVLMDLQIVPVSSSLVRWLLDNGRMRDAAICLGRAYAILGTVETGRQRGRKLGFPTANLKCADQMIPADGVYAGRCRVNDRDYAAALSIGRAPTFNQTHRQVEAHLIGFTGDLYGQSLTIELIDWLRDQRRFDGPDSLRRQLTKDIAQAASFLHTDPSRSLEPATMATSSR
jgi:riboflavin kinase/FMN adenylyltransferase